jgi:hypothetical protein
VVTPCWCEKIATASRCSHAWNQHTDIVRCRPRQSRDHHQPHCAGGDSVHKTLRLFILPPQPQVSHPNTSVLAHTSRILPPFPSRRAPRAPHPFPNPWPWVAHEWRSGGGTTIQGLSQSSSSFARILGHRLQPNGDK